MFTDTLTAIATAIADNAVADAAFTFGWLESTEHADGTVSTDIDADFAADASALFDSEYESALADLLAANVERSLPADVLAAWADVVNELVDAGKPTLGVGEWTPVAVVAKVPAEHTYIRGAYTRLIELGPVSEPRPPMADRAADTDTVHGVYAALYRTAAHDACDMGADHGAHVAPFESRADDAAIRTAALADADTLASIADTLAYHDAASIEHEIGATLLDTFGDVDVDTDDGAVYGMQRVSAYFGNPASVRTQMAHAILGNVDAAEALDA